MKKIILVLFLTIFSVQFLFPTFARANGGGFSLGLVPCGQGDRIVNNVVQSSPPCDLQQFVIMIRNIIDFLGFLSIPIATIAITVAGFVLIFARGNVERIKYAKNILIKVLIGFLIVLCAWGLVYLITSTLLDPCAQYLGTPSAACK